MRHLVDLQTLSRRNNVPREERDAEPKRSTGYGHPITVVAIVSLAFAIRYWFNFVAVHVNNYGSADASEYLRNAQALFELRNLPVSFWTDAWNVLAQKADAATIEHVRTSLAPLKDFYISGPVFPLFIALAYAIAGGGHVDILNWGPPLMAQCIVSALTCGLIALAGGLAYSRATGYFAGLIAAFYPAFIVNSGRLYSETLAAFLLTAVIYFTVRGLTQQQGYGKAFQLSFFNGIASASLQFTRSVMVIISIALVPITFIQYGVRKGIVALVALVIGFAAVAAPWLALQQLAFGSASLVVDRVGNYNFFTGNNTDTQGWLSFPYPDGRGIDDKSIPTLAKEAISKNPRRWFQLMEDKPLRLFKFPWNDFRTAIGDVPFKMQVLYHQLLMVLAFVGATLGLVASTSKRPPDFGYERPGRQPKDQTPGRLFLLFVFGIHLAYLFFITVPRYNLTAMPVLIIFAAAGVTSIIRLFTARGGIMPAISIIFAIALLFAAGELDITSAFATAFGVKATYWGFVFRQALTGLAALGLGAFLRTAIAAAAPRNPFETRKHPSVGYAMLTAIICTAVALPIAAIPAAANGRWYEWKAPFDVAGQTITQRIHLAPGDWKAIGKRPLYLMIDADGASTLDGASLRINGQPAELCVIPSISLTDDFSRLISARGNKMREGEWIFSCMTESVPMRNADLRQWFLVPLDNIERGKDVTVSLRRSNTAPGTIYGAYNTGKRIRHIPSLAVCSWEKAFYGVENPDGLSDPRYDTRVAASTFVDSEDDLSVSKGLQTGTYNIRLLAAPGVVPNQRLVTVEMPVPPSGMPITEHKFGSSSIQDKASRSFLASDIPAASTHDFWFVRYKGAVRRNAGAAQLKLTFRANGTGEPYLSPWTPTLSCTTNKTSFDFAVPIEPAAITGLRSFDLTTASTGTEHGITEISDLTMQILKTPYNPIAPGSTIF